MVFLWLKLETSPLNLKWLRWLSNLERADIKMAFYVPTVCDMARVFHSVIGLSIAFIMSNLSMINRVNYERQRVKHDKLSIDRSVVSFLLFFRPPSLVSPLLLPSSSLSTSRPSSFSTFSCSLVVVVLLLVLLVLLVLVLVLLLSLLLFFRLQHQEMAPRWVTEHMHIMYSPYPPPSKLYPLPVTPCLHVPLHASKLLYKGATGTETFINFRRRQWNCCVYPSLILHFAHSPPPIIPRAVTLKLTFSV